MGSGYVLDFSNRTIEEHFEDEFGIDFYSDKFALNGDSKAKRLRTILEASTGPLGAAILRNLWDVRATLPSYRGRQDPDEETALRNQYFQVIDVLEGGQVAADLSALSNFEASETLHTLIQSMERDLRDDAPEAAMDRLHLFCITQFRHLLEFRKLEVRRDEPLHSLVARYKNALEDEGGFSEMSLLFIQYSIAVFEKFNEIRNERSLAHDNELLPAQEARFIFDAVSAVLRFIKSIDKGFDG